MDLLVKLGTFMLLVILVAVGIMVLISVADRYTRKDGSQKKREKRP